MIESLAKQVAQEISKAPEFEALKKARSTLEKNTAAKMSLEQFQKDQAHIRAIPKSDSEIKELKKTFDSLMQNPDIAEYYRAGYKFESLVGHFHQLIDTLLEDKVQKRE